MNTPTRTAIVTGAARGIGAAVARRLAADGMAVAVLDLHEETCHDVVEAIDAAGGRALAVGANVADEASVAAAYERIAADLGAPTVLVNNAGIIRDHMIHKMPLDDWEAVMGVHLRGAFLMTRALRPHVAANRHGRVVCISSTSALGNMGQANYSAAKAGLQGFVKTVALEFGRYGGTANAVGPGFIETDMMHVTADRLGLTVEEFRAEAAGPIPLERVGTPDDIAGVVSFFCSDDASYVSGQVLYVAGGPRD